MPAGVTTLYFETEREDDLRRVGYSKERRVDPRVIVGLLVDRAGFPPLQVGCWEGNKAETTTIIPIAEAFQQAHGIAELVIVADAGMLSAANLAALNEAGVGFIVGARQVRAPGDLEAHLALGTGRPRRWPAHQAPSPPNEAAAPRSGTRPSRPSPSGPRPPTRARGEPSGPCSKKRAARDHQTLTAQANRARAARRRPEATQTHQGHAVCLPPTPVTRPWTRPAWPEPGPWWGLKGYTTFHPVPPDGRRRGRLLVPRAVARPSSPLRISKHDLSARPRLPPHPPGDLGPPDRGHDRPDRRPPPPGHHRDNHHQNRREPRGLQDVTTNLNGHHLTTTDPLTPQAEKILTALNIPTEH